ncbi:MAG TPA: hypothetical protein VG275_07100 [Solirubrobacteraceae bacterium]|jgi:hypothetical protein|nr:hypothetical protein [Solirubrobacteraceae bacterium]
MTTGHQESPRTIAGTDAHTAGVYAGLALVAIGSIAPWVTSPLVSAGGLDGDGKVTILLAALAAFLLWRRGRDGAFSRLVAEGVLILGFAVYNAVHIHQIVARYTLYGAQLDHVGWGVYAVIAGAVLCLGALWKGRVQS